MSKNEDLKKENEHKIRKCFYNGSLWTKNQLSNETGISLAATTNVLQSLQEKDEIIYLGEGSSTGGRKSKLYQLNRDFYHILKVNLKRDEVNHTMTFHTVNLFNETIKVQSIKTKTGKIKELLAMMDSIMQDNQKIAIIVINVPGICKNGIIDICDFEDFEGVRLKTIIKDKYSIDAVIENDVNVACIGFSSKYPKCKNLAFIYQPRIKYVGCGIVIDGKLYNGFSHFAGELRYLPFYTHEQQDQLLKSDPKDLLLNQLETMCTVLNPEVVGIHSDILPFPYLSSFNSIPLFHQPLLDNVEDFNKVIMDGIYRIGLQELKEKRGFRRIDN